MSRSLYKLSLRALLSPPGLSALALLGVALGVAAVVSIELTSQSVLTAFRSSGQELSGGTTHVIEGGPEGVPESLFPRLVTGLGLEAAPVIEGFARAEAASPSAPGTKRSEAPGIRLLGIDPFSEAPFRDWTRATDADSGGSEGGRVVRELMTGGVLLPSGFLGGGDARSTHVSLLVQGRRATLPIVGTLGEGVGAVGSVAVLDLAVAQSLLGKTGRLDRIELRMPGIPSTAGCRPEDEGAHPTLARLCAALPGGIRLGAPSAQAEALVRLTRAFRLNLDALGLLALLVGTFLIHQTVAFSVVRRQRELATVRALGASRGELFALTLGQAGVLGLAATALGLVGGALLARGLLALVEGTVNDLYFATEVDAVRLEGTALLKGAALGLLGALASALAPAWEAATEPPRGATVRVEPVGQRLVVRSLLGVVFLGAGAALLLLPSRSLPLALAAVPLLCLGHAALAPGFSALLLLGAGRLTPTRGAPWLRMAVRSLARGLSRVGGAVAALAIAVALAVAVSVMVDSMRATVVGWLEETLVADVYVSIPGPVARRGGVPLPEELVDRLQGLPEVGRSIDIRVFDTQLEGHPFDLLVVGVDALPYARRPQRFLGAAPEAVWPRLEQEDAVAVSEPLAFHLGLAVGDRVRLPTPHGEQAFEVVAVFRDYGSDIGSMMLARSTYLRHFTETRRSGLGLFAAQGVTPEALLRAVEAATGGAEIVARSNRGLRERSLIIFDRTFEVTRVLRLLAVAVAFTGILASFLALLLERRRELALMRALGTRPREVRAWVMAQATLLGLCAGLWSIPLGLGLSVALVHVINRRAFGWTLDLSLSGSQPLQAMGLALIAALLAGVYPALQAARGLPSQTLKEDEA